MRKLMLVILALAVLAIAGCEVGTSHNDIDINSIEQLERWIELYNEGL